MPKYLICVKGKVIEACSESDNLKSVLEVAEAYLKRGHSITIDVFGV